MVDFPLYAALIETRWACCWPLQWIILLEQCPSGKAFIQQGWQGWQIAYKPQTQRFLFLKAASPHYSSATKLEFSACSCCSKNYHFFPFSPKLFAYFLRILVFIGPAGLEGPEYIKPEQDQVWIACPYTNNKRSDHLLMEWNMSLSSFPFHFW